MDLPLDPVEVYVAEVPHLTWHPVDLMTWKQIQDAGLEHNRRNRHHWIVAVLPISDADQAGLRGYDAPTRKRFETLERKIQYSVLIDHGNGVVRLVQKQ